MSSPRAKIDTFIEKNPNKKPLFLVNFPLKAEKKETGLALSELFSPANQSMLQIIKDVRKSVASSLLLLADDKSMTVRMATPFDITYEPKDLDTARRDYYKSNKIPEIITTLGLEDMIVKTNSERPIFSELKLLNNPTEEQFATGCAKTYHTLLENEIDRTMFSLISFIPMTCYTNLTNYFRTGRTDLLKQQLPDLTLQNIFVDAEDPTDYTFYEI